MQVQGYINKDGEYLQTSLLPNRPEQKQISGSQKGSPQRNAEDVGYEDLPPETKEFIESRRRQKSEMQNA